ncbi:FCD domain-containing protein, partial [Rhizobium johnstonii]
MPRRFHRLLIAPCDMPRLLAAIDDLHTVGSRLLFVSGRGGWKPRVDVDHHAILDHLRKGKIEQAIVVLDRHVQRIGK